CSSSVTIFDTAGDGAVIGSFSTHQPYGVATSPDGRAVYVSNGNAQKVSVYDATIFPPQLVCEIPVGFQPTHIATSPDGTGAVVSVTNGLALSVLDTSLDPTTTCPVEIARISLHANPFGNAISPDSQFAYASQSFSRDMAVINLSSLSLEEYVPVGEQAAGLGLSPAGGIARIGFSPGPAGGRGHPPHPPGAGD